MLDFRIDNVNCLQEKNLRRLSVGVRGKRIAYLGTALSAPPARRVIDGRGLTLSPGFIDAHTHSELYLLRGKRALAKIAQGITTEITGNCGLGVFPFRSTAAARAYLQGYRGVFGDGAVTWRTLSGYARAVTGRTPVNLAPLSTYGTLRLYAAGNASRPLTAAERRALARQLRTELALGTRGLSLGMIYPPCSYADETELRAALRVLAEFPGRVLAVHGWDEGNQTVESVQRVLALTRGLPLRVELSHLKAYGRANWHKYDTLARVVRAARRRGQDVGFDISPYAAGSTTANALLPPWVQAGGPAALCARLRDPQVVARLREELAQPATDWENFLRTIGTDRIRLTNLRVHRRLAGRSIAEGARRLHTDVVSALCRVIADEQGQAGMLMFSMDERRVARLCREPLAVPGSDGLFGKGMHPRAFGTMPAYFRAVTRGRDGLTAGEALWKMSTQGAERFGLHDRGHIAVGAVADLVLLDLPRFAPRATYAEPEQTPTGVRAVWVNGILAYDGIRVCACPGRVL